MMLAKMRAAVRRMLTDRCTIERETHTTGAYGDVVRAWALVASDVPCRIITARRTDLNAASLTAGRETLSAVYRIALPHDTALQADDRITVNGQVFGVTRIEAAQTDRAYVSAIIARR